MSKLMVPVVRDLVAENTGIESLVGKMVEVVKKIPRYKTCGRCWRTPSLPGTPGCVYLVNAEKTRFMFGKTRAEQAIVLFEGYEGNDIYSAEELGL